jgi:hypothetical protein
MRRERALKVVLVLVGLVFSAGVFPVRESLWHQNQSMYTFDMMLSLYVALGIFLLIAARNPSANRSLIAFTAWSCFAHAAVMAVTAFSKGLSRRPVGRGCACHHRCSPDRAGPGKAVRRAGIGSRCIGSQSKSAMHACFRWNKEKEYEQKLK